MSTSGNVVVDLDCNVNIKIFDKHQKLIRDSYTHNKATVSLVDGILRFLRGDFSQTSYSRAASPGEAIPYLPTRASFGYIGVDLTEKDSSGKRYFDFVDSSKFASPVFGSSALQEQCYVDSERPLDFTFNRIRQTGYHDLNNSECLEFSLYLSPGSLVGRLITTGEDESAAPAFIPYEWSYWNPVNEEYEAMITEVGLMSDLNVLLARVLFDGEVETLSMTPEDPFSQYPSPQNPGDDSSPIIQSESSTVVLTWRIGIVSVGKNDRFVSLDDFPDESVSLSLADSILNSFTVSGSDGSQVDSETLSALISSSLKDILDGPAINLLKEDL